MAGHIDGGSGASMPHGRGSALLFTYFSSFRELLLLALEQSTGAADRTRVEHEISKALELKLQLNKKF